MKIPGSPRKSPRTAKTPPVKRVVLSPDERAAYERLVRERDERDRAYARHLSSDNRQR